MRDSVQVKLFAQDGELYVPAKSEGRQAKEMAIRPSCPDVGRAFGFVKINLPGAGKPSRKSKPPSNA